MIVMAGIQFTIGKNTCIVDGKEQRMGYTLTDFDGLPLFDIVHFCDVFGFTVDLNENDEIEIAMHPQTVKMVEEFKNTFTNDLFGTDLSVDWRVVIKSANIAVDDDIGTYGSASINNTQKGGGYS